MGIDVRFIQQLPASFIDQDTLASGDPGLFRFIRDADQNHDGDLSRDEIEVALPSHPQQNNLGRAALAEDFEQRISNTCDFIRNTLQSGQVSLGNTLFQSRLWAIRGSQPLFNQERWARYIDRNGDARLDRSEILRSISNRSQPQINLLEARLRRTAEGLLAMEAHPEHRGLMNLFHLAGYLPMQVMGGLGNTFGSEHHATTIHEQIRIYANMRHENRLTAIQHFIDAWRENPARDPENILASLAETDRTLLEQDLHLNHWIFTLQASSPESMIDRHLQMVEVFIQGNYSEYSLQGGAYLDELLVTPWRSENYAMANDIITALEQRNDLSPSQREQVRNWRERIRSTNLLGILELPRPDSWNEGWDFVASTAIELFLLRGGLKGVKVARALLGARVAYGLNCIRGILGISTGVAAESTAAAASATSAASEAGLVRQGFRYLGMGIGYLFRGLGWATAGISTASGVGMANNMLIPPERHQNNTDVDFQIPETDLNNPWINANLASLAFAIYESEHP